MATVTMEDEQKLVCALLALSDYLLFSAVIKISLLTYLLIE